jgi:hypothetical protein
MTIQLGDDIFRAARDAYDTANPQPKPSNEFVQAVRNAIENSPAQKFLAKVSEDAKAQELTSEYLYGTNCSPKRYDCATVKVKLRSLTSIVTSNRRNDTDPNCDITLATPMHYYRLHDDPYSWTDATVYINDFRDEDKPDLVDMFTKFKKSEEAHAEARIQYDRQIKELVTKCTTLKQLLQIWPGAESLVPNNKLQELHRKVTRAQRAQTIKEEISFDPTVANQAVLTAKLLGG